MVRDVDANGPTMKVLSRLKADKIWFLMGTLLCLISRTTAHNSDKPCIGPQVGRTAFWRLPRSRENWASFDVS